jgi:hypothetical protein
MAESRRQTPWWGGEPVKPVGGTPAEGAQAFYEAAAQRTYRRAGTTGADEYGYVWVEPSPTINPARPRTQRIGYSLAERRIRTIFRDGTKWAYEDVSPQEWERVRRTASTGRFIGRVLDHHPYGPDNW